MKNMLLSSGGVVFKAGKVVLLKKKAGWVLPKGTVEKGETIEEAAIREVREETGLQNIRILSEIGHITYKFLSRGKPVKKTVYFFLMETTDDALLPGEEFQDARWFSFENAEHIMAFENQKGIVRKALGALP